MGEKSEMMGVPHTKGLEKRRAGAIVTQKQMGEAMDRDNPALKEAVLPWVLAPPAGANWTYEQVVWALIDPVYATNPDNDVVDQPFQDTPEERWQRVVRMANSPIVQAYAQTRMAQDRLEDRAIEAIKGGTDMPDEERITLTGQMEGVVLERFEVFLGGFEKWATRVELLTKDQVRAKKRAWKLDETNLEQLRAANERRSQEPQPRKYPAEALARAREKLEAGSGYGEIATELEEMGIETDAGKVKGLIMRNRNRHGGISFNDVRTTKLKEFEYFAKEIIREQGNKPNLEETLDHLEAMGYDRNWAKNRMGVLGLRAERVRWESPQINGLSLNDALDRAFEGTESTREGYDRFISLLDQQGYKEIIPTIDSVASRRRRKGGK